jgi:predicted RNA-binding Zn ribbon-like protein
MADEFEKPWRGVGIGGSTALDFANTLDWRRREKPVELLEDFDDLLRWARTAHVMDRRQARDLRAWGARNATAARRALTRAIQVREAIAAVARALAVGRGVPRAPLARLDAACHEADAERALVSSPGGVTWSWRDAPGPDRPAWAAALDAAEIITSAQRDRVRECGDAECGWLFLDTSRNRTRRWCSMLSCGNRNKARSFYRRSARRARARRSPAVRA